MTDQATIRDDLYIYNLMQDNVERIVDAIARFNPLYAQSISNLQVDYLHALRNIMYALISAQRQAAATTTTFLQSNYVPNVWQPWLLPLNPFILPGNRDANNLTKQQINQYVDYGIGIMTFNNRATINILDAATENIRIYEKLSTTLSEYSQKISEALNVLLSR